MTDVVPEESVRFDWRDFDHDAVGNYTVDCRINGMSSPLFVYALSSNTKARDATIALHKFREWGLEFEPVGVFENKDAIAQKVLARFGDVCATQFSSFPNDRGSIERYLTERITQRG